MNEILETTYIEFEKSSFLIDIVRHSNGKSFIEINQIIHQDNSGKNSIRLNPSILNEMIEVLQNYKNKIFAEQYENEDSIWEETKNKIQKRYLKGISIKELKMQFGYSEKVIKMFLENSGIEIVSTEIPKAKSRRRRK